MFNLNFEDHPHLKRRLLAFIPFLLALFGFGSSYFGNFYCDNVQFTPDIEIDPDDFYHPRVRSYGLWMFRWHQFSNELDGKTYMREGCVNYPKGHPLWDFDGKWKAARAFSCIATIVAGFMIFWSFCAPLLLFDGLFWRWAIIVYIFIAICEGLTLLFLWSNGCSENPLLQLHVPDPSIYPLECSWDTGTWCQILGVAFYGLAAISMCIIPAPGLRPKDQEFPIMIWEEDDEDSEDDDEDAEVSKSFNGHSSSYRDDSGDQRNGEVDEGVLIDITPEEERH